MGCQSVIERSLAGKTDTDRIMAGKTQNDRVMDARTNTDRVLTGRTPESLAVCHDFWLDAQRTDRVLHRGSRRYDRNNFDRSVSATQSDTVNPVSGGPVVVHAWFYPFDITQGSGIVGLHDNVNSTTERYELRFSSSTMQGELRTNAGSERIDHTGSLTENGWNDAALTWNEDAPTGEKQSLSLNGVVESTDGPPDPPLRGVDGPGVAILGQVQTSGTAQNFFNGRVFPVVVARPPHHDNWTTTRDELLAWLRNDGNGRRVEEYLALSDSKKAEWNIVHWWEGGAAQHSQEADGVARVDIIDLIGDVDIMYSPGRADGGQMIDFDPSVNNGGFENWTDGDPDDWSASTSGTSTVNEETNAADVFHGDRAVRFDLDENNSSAALYMFGGMLSPNKRYKGEVSFKSTGGATGFMRFGTASSRVSVPASNEYVDHQFVQVADSEDRIGLERAGGGANQSLWYDAFRLTPLESMSADGNHAALARPGDLVFRVLDRIDEIQISQESVLSRPSYRSAIYDPDGEAVPYHWLDLDGQDDFLQSAGAVTDSTAGSLLVLLRLAPGSTGGTLLSARAPADPDTYVRMRVDSDGRIEVDTQLDEATHTVRGSSDLRTGEFRIVELHSDGANWSMRVDEADESLTVVAGENSGRWYGAITEPTATLIGAHDDQTPEDHYDGDVTAVELYPEMLADAALDRALDRMRRYRDRLNAATAE